MFLGEGDSKSKIYSKSQTFYMKVKEVKKNINMELNVDAFNCLIVEHLKRGVEVAGEITGRWMVTLSFLFNGRVLRFKRPNSRTKDQQLYYYQWLQLQLTSIAFPFSTAVGVT
ncbi:hypothetical protein CEXT_568661 [Caerostris extrusa]|uniref:Uncharacterized protein n=1 Tax=Caerostris extrusa TaxID=172846 RepID=A0AAV4USG9_CAEEX|nr:hypothetical protein CEXT_568661 [Caerostris extrusa]